MISLRAPRGDGGCNSHTPDPGAILANGPVAQGFLDKTDISSFSKPRLSRCLVRTII